MSFIEDIPDFFTRLMCKSSVSTTEEKWIQIINQELSPKLWEFVMTFALSTIEPLIKKIFKQNNLPDINFQFTKLDFGDISPQIDNLKVHNISPTEDSTKSVIIDFDLSYLGNSDLQISVLGLQTGGVR